MNKLLEKAFAEASQRPEDEQEAIASIILDELADEAAWQAKFQRDAGKLSQLARKALDQHARGQTTPLSFPNEP